MGFSVLQKFTHLGLPLGENLVFSFARRLPKNQVSSVISMCVCVYAHAHVCALGVVMKSCTAWNRREQREVFSADVHPPRSQG